MLPERLCVVLHKHQVVFVFISRLLEWCLACHHVEENHTESKHIRFARLMKHFKVDLRRHVVDRSNKRFARLLQTRSENEIGYFHVEVVFVVNKQILRLQIPVCETFIVNVLQSVNQLFEVVSGYRLLQTACFAQNNEQISLVCGKHEVRVGLTAEKNKIRVNTRDDVQVTNNVVYLLLVFSLVNLCLLSFV